MSITILTGAPGHGKSYTSVQMIDDFVHKGKFVVTNVALRHDFAEQMAKRHTALGFIRKKAVQDKAELYASRIHACEDLTEIMRVRFMGKKEGRGKIVIEEAHRHMNVRAGRGVEKDERKVIVEYASGHRHYGGDMILITQAIGNLDLQVKNLFEYHAEVRNLRKLPILGLLVRLLMPGGQLFIRKTVWNDKARTRAGIAVYGLSKRLANLYDTHSLEETDWPDDAIVLPKRPLTITEQVDVAWNEYWRDYSSCESSSFDSVSRTSKRLIKNTNGDRNGSIESDIGPNERKRLRKKEVREKAAGVK